MRVAILGVTGRTGRRVAAAALARGHEIRALVRGDPPPELVRPGVVLVRGDARDADRVAEVVAGADAVIAALGPSRRSLLVAAASMRHIVAACHRHAVPTVVALSGALVPLPDERRSLLQRLRWAIAQLVARPVTADKLAERDALITSGLRWVFVRPPRLLEAHDPSLAVRFDRPARGQISRDALAVFLLDQAEAPTLAGQAPYVSSEPR
jgi:putative NADH-flavin reductase